MGPVETRQVQEEHAREWMSIPGVVAIGVGELAGKPCIRVFAAKKTTDVIERIPSQAGGYPVVIEEAGEIRPLRQPRSGGAVKPL